MPSNLAEEIEPGIFVYVGTGEDATLALLSGRYMGPGEIRTAENLGSAKRRREHLASRIALKDAVRNFVWRSRDETLRPIEILCTHDERGKPLVYGEGDAAQLLYGVHVSLAHKDAMAVAMASGVPVGIDLERIDGKSRGFEEITCTTRERELLASLKCPDGVIRFWVAKEACAKKAGVGLGGNPKRFEITAADGDELSVGNEKVRTRLLREEYVVGWTL